MSMRNDEDNLLGAAERRVAQLRAVNEKLVLATLKAQQLQTDAERVQRRQIEFLALLAHELRNPLAPLRTGLDILEAGSDDPAVNAEARAMMNRQLRQLVHLVDDLLDGARIAGAGLQIATERVSLATVIAQAVETSAPNLRTAGHRFEAHISDEPILVDADPFRLAQVFTNLLNNAACYTPDGGRIAISLRREGNQAVVSVTDSGIGIAPADVETIFEMFMRGAQGRAGRQGGLGIGLALVRSVVELHGGSVTAHSAGVGSGSTFVVSLPAAPAGHRPSAGFRADAVG